MGVNILVDAFVQLGAIHHGAASVGALLLDCVDRVAVNLEPEVCVVEGANQGAECKLLIDVFLYILLVE